MEARLLIRQPVPGTAIEPDRYELIVDSIGRGPPEDDRGPGFFDDDEGPDER